MANRPIWPAQPIHSAANVPLSSNPGTLPNMADTISNWFQLLIVEQVVKTIVNFQVVENTVPIMFQGVVEIMTPRELMMKPEGQRLWRWKKIYCWPNVPLKPDDVVVYEDVQYRIMQATDYKQYGYREYHVMEDYTGSGPEVPTT